MSRDVAVVSHSHWDREWYASFESYRIRLVAMMDGLLDLLEADPDFTHFYLDGQTALVDDYLATRPAQQPRLEKLVRAGRLAIGPWYVLMDEFCVSGETIVRNLQLGLSRAEQLGGAGRMVGYLPDMFGHVAQMPQLLVQAGIDHAVVWRGVPASVDRSGFWWSSPDGSTVRAEYLPVGYSNGAFLPHDPARLVGRVAAHDQELERFLPEGWPLLLMNGGDHHQPQEWVPALLHEANHRADRSYRFEQTSLAAYLRGAPTTGLPRWSGELRSGARAPILMGVLSSRVDLKQAAAATEVAMERVAEPLAALWLPPDLWPGELIDRAWLEVIRNSAHDSICGCSADEVGRAVRTRFDTALALASEVADRAAAIAGVATRSAGPLVLNPSARDRRGLVEVDLPGTQAPAGTQQTARTDGLVTERRGRGRDLGRILAELVADGLAGSSGPGQAATLGQESGAIVLALHVDPARVPDPGMPAVMAEAWAQAGSVPDGPLVVRVHRAPAQRVLVQADVPGWGWARWSESGGDPVSAVTATPLGIDNGLVSIDIDPASGTFSLDGVAGQNLLVDEADGGDTYNFSPVVGAVAVGDPNRVAVEPIEGGPLRAIIRVRRWYSWAEVVSDLEVRAGERAVRVTTMFDNHTMDHRVRAWFPLRRPAGRTVAECAFATVSRPAEAEGGPQEPPVPAYPSRRFVTAGDITVAHQGLLEHELTNQGTVLAVTLLRATGIIARPAPASRPVLAGPPVPLRDAQMPGPQTFRYVLAPGCPDPWALADHLWTPLLTVRAAGGGHLEDKGRRLRLEGAEVSALYRRGGKIEVRVFNPSDDLVTVRLPDHSGWLVDLRGEATRRWEGEFELRPWAIATARLDRDLG